MKEVSFSPVMGTMLSFTNSKSVAASGYHPDENYAREIMQLFSVRLLDAAVHDHWHALSEWACPCRWSCAIAA